MRKELIKELCFYLGEIEYILEKSYDYREISNLEQEREAIHKLLGLEYKRKRYTIYYKQVISKL